MNPNIDAYIISWPGRYEAALAIAEQLAGAVARVTIIHSEEGEFSPSGEFRCVVVSNDWFHGKKFKRALDEFDGDVMLQITADARCSDWPGLAERCAKAFKIAPQLGAWTPSVDYTYWTIDKTFIEYVDIPYIKSVTMTDSIVWGASKSVIDRLRQLDYEDNNLGWGIDMAAAAYCHTNNRLVLMDSSVRVDHPKSRGYDSAEARAQCMAFLEQLTLQEQIHLILMRRYHDTLPGAAIADDL